MSVDLLREFSEEVEVEYNGETYLVRDNGAVFRQTPPSKRKRKLDGEWTFGRQDGTKGYMVLGSHVIHRIVARAFHPQPTPEHVVDHIDTNRANNRVDNLRWVTRLENVLMNPITRKRIINVYGSLDAFFENPSAISLNVPEFDWMRTVTKEEAERSRRRLRKWAESDSPSKGGRLGEWIYRPDEIVELVDDQPKVVESSTFGAVQRNWRSVTEFPACPTKIGSGSLAEYASSLIRGTVFSRNEFGETLVEVAETNEEMLCVVSRFPQESVKGWALAKVTIGGDKFVHEALGTFFTLEGAKNEFNAALGIDAPRIQTIDDLT